MNTRKHTHQIDLDGSPERVFALLVTPSAIRNGWSAPRAVVVAQAGGTWAAAWGTDGDLPACVTSSRIRTFKPPHRLVLADSSYFAKAGPLPFKPDFVIEFIVMPRPGGCTLRVSQDGFPLDPIADAFYAGCEVGWKNTCEGIRRFLAEEGSKRK